MPATDCGESERSRSAERRLSASTTPTVAELKSGPNKSSTISDCEARTIGNAYSERRSRRRAITSTPPATASSSTRWTTAATSPPIAPHETHRSGDDCAISDPSCSGAAHRADVCPRRRNRHRDRVVERAYVNRESPMMRLGVFWDWLDLHGDPRFQDLLRRLKLPPT